MPTSDIWIEKLGFGHYMIHRIEKDPECIADMMDSGFSAAVDNPDEYVKDKYDDDQTLNFGITMADCFNQLLNNQGFITAYTHLISLKPVSAKARKEAQDSISKEELLVALLSLQDLDEFLYTYAENYSKSLVDEAKIHLDKGLDEFAQWLSSGSVKSRKDLKHSIADYYALDRKRSKFDLCANVCIGFILSKENKETYEEWKDSFDNDEFWAEYIRSFSETYDESNNTIYYYSYYYYSGNLGTDDLFEILNVKDSHYSTQTKRLIHNVLTDHSQKDIEFARELQCKYDEYRAVNGGTERTFMCTAANETAKGTQQMLQAGEKPVQNDAAFNSEEKASTNEAETQDTPKKEEWRLQKYLCREIKLDEKTKLPYCKGFKKSIVKAGAAGDRALTKFIQYLADRRYIDNDKTTKNSFAYALTGRGNFRKMKIITVKWHPTKEDTREVPESVRVLLYISSNLFESDKIKGSTYSQLFNVLDAGPNPCIKDGKDQSSAYYDKVSEDFEEYFNECFGRFTKDFDKNTPNK